jgi:predicted HTH domain antitoxin
MTATVSLPTIEIDDSILLSLKETKEQLADDMKFYTAVMLYKKDKLSLGKAALFTGCNKADFLQRLEKENIPVFDFDHNIIKQIEDDSSF